MDMDHPPNFLATHAHSHRPLKRKLAADDDDAPGPTAPHTHTHTQPADHQHPHAHAHAHAGPAAECGGSSSSSAAGGSGSAGISISISIAPAAPRQTWIADADDPSAAAARWASPSPSPTPSSAPSPTTTTVPQVPSPLSACRASKRLRVDTQDAVVRPAAHARAHGGGSGGTKHYPRRAAAIHKPTASPLQTSPLHRQGSDLEDIGVVSRASPGPSSGSLLRSPRTPIASGSGSNDVSEGVGVNGSENGSPVSTSATSNVCVVPPPPLKLSRSPHIPPMMPPITRGTLRELELDVILRNPVIRHDLLFDPGLQFRPPRSHAARERYWDALWREVRLGCTCVTLDVHGGVHPTRCICDNVNRYPATPTLSTPATPITPSLPTTSTTPISPSTPTAPLAPTSTPAPPHQHPQPLYTLRTPPRLPLLLAELRAVLLLVVQPLSTSQTTVYTNPAAVRAQAEEHARHADELREVLDGVLEVGVLGGPGRREGRGLETVNLGPVFMRIGATLKRHCAPMRDRRVDAMVAAAGEGGAHAFGAVRMCLELLELMKLDIANHQLAQLRPWLLRNTSAFEAKAFRIRFGAGPRALRHTRAWLASADRALCGARGANKTQSISTAHSSEAATTSASTTASEEAQVPVPAPGPLAHTPYARLTCNQRIYLSVLKGLVDLVFGAAPGDPLSQTLKEPVRKEEGERKGKDFRGHRDREEDGDVEMSEEVPTVVCPASPSSASNPSSAARDKSPSSPSPVPSTALPETLYLDKTRLVSLAGEASDATAIYMLALLFRQLVGTDASVSAALDNADVVNRLKDELRVLAPAGLGVCFITPGGQVNKEGKQEQNADAVVEMVQEDAQEPKTLPLPHQQRERHSKKEKDTEDEREQRRRVREDVALQIASRAEDVHQQRRHHHGTGTPTNTASTSTTSVENSTTSNTTSTPTAPSSALLALAQRWTSTHMQPDAALARLLHTRVRDAVLDEVIALVYPSNTNGGGGVDLTSAGAMHVFAGRAGYAPPPPLFGIHSHGHEVGQGGQPVLVGAERKHSLGLDTLAGEIRRLASRVARLAEVHLGTHLPMYESEGFLEGEGEGEERA